MRNSEILRVKLELMLPDLFDAGVSVFNHPQARELFPRYLLCLHSIIRASVPLMSAALKVCDTVDLGGFEAGVLASYYKRHIEEEKNHDEWLIEDLAALGVSRERVHSHRPSATVAQLVGSQYYWINHYHPSMLLAYIAVMEGYPPKTEQLESLQNKLNLPPDCLRTLHIHAAVDPDHRDDLYELVDNLSLSGCHNSMLGVNAIMTTRLVSGALREVTGYVSRQSR